MESLLTTGAAVFLALLVGGVTAIYAYATRHFGYWRRQGVPFLRPLPLAGNLKDALLFRKPLGEVLHDVYTQMEDQPYVGMFFFDQPVLFVKDIELWKKIVIKDFDHFEDRGFAPLQSAGIFSETLFGTKGNKWRKLRAKLSPAFTLGKLKRFYFLLEQKAANLDHYFDDIVKEGAACDVTDACARYTMDAIASVGFGLETTALTDDDDALHRLLRRIFVYSKLFTLVSLATFVDLPLLRLLGVSLVPAPLAAFLRSAVWGAARERQRVGALGRRGDFLDLLLELRDKGSIAQGDDPDDDVDDVDAKAAADAAGAAIYMDGDVLIAQAFSVLAAGFDTTSTTMSFALYELAKNEEMQEKLRTLLQEAIRQHDGKLTYAALQNVAYLDMIFSGLRLAYLQGKLGIAHIILNYRLDPCASTPHTMDFNLHSFLISPRDGVPLRLTRVARR